MKTKGQVQLEEHGFSKIESRWSGRWFTAVSLKGEEVCFLRQRSGAWHAFFPYAGTASGYNPTSALMGGLGDVIDTNVALRGYCRSVRNAPVELVKRFNGLYEALQSARNS